MIWTTQYKPGFILCHHNRDFHQHIPQSYTQEECGNHTSPRPTHAHHKHGGKSNIPKIFLYHFFSGGVGIVPVYWNSNSYKKIYLPGAPSIALEVPSYKIPVPL